MSKCDDFSLFAESFFLCSPCLQGEFLTLDVSKLKISYDVFLNSLRENGIAAEIHKDDEKIIVDVSSVNLDANSTVFTSIDSLWRRGLYLNQLPENYLVIKEKTSSLVPCDLVKKINLHLQWKQVVCPLTVHEIHGKTVWYLADENGGQEVVIDIVDNLRDVKEYSYSELSLISAKNLKEIIDLKDAQANERKSILRKAISDFVGEEHNFRNVVSAGERVLNRYNDLFDLYTKRFSVDKILNDIETKNIEYTAKINEYISSSQSKSFTIPGALIAVGALFKSGGFWEGILILIGLYMVYFLAKSANDAQRESYDDLKSSLKESFKRYHQFDEGAEVRKAAKNTLDLLNEKINRANIRLNDIDSLGRIMQGIAFLYIVTQIFLAK